MSLRKVTLWITEDECWVPFLPRLHPCCLIWSAAVCSAVNAHLPSGHRVSNSTLRTSHQICFFLALANANLWAQESPVIARDRFHLDLMFSASAVVASTSSHHQLKPCAVSTAQAIQNEGIVSPFVIFFYQCTCSKRLQMDTSHTLVLDGFFLLNNTLCPDNTFLPELSQRHCYSHSHLLDEKLDDQGSFVW